MIFRVSKSGEDWKVRKVETRTDPWKVKYLNISDVYYVIVDIEIGKRDHKSYYGQALFEGMRAIEKYMDSTHWKKDFGQI